MTEYLIEYRYNRDAEFDDDFDDAIQVVIEAKTMRSAISKATKHKGPLAEYWRVKTRQIQVQAWALDEYLTAARETWDNIIRKKSVT